MRQAARRIVTDHFLTGSAGRLTAFALDLGIASGAYLLARLRGRRPEW